MAGICFPGTLVSLCKCISLTTHHKRRFIICCWPIVRQAMWTFELNYSNHLFPVLSSVNPKLKQSDLGGSEIKSWGGSLEGWRCWRLLNVHIYSPVTQETDFSYVWVKITPPLCHHRPFWGNIACTGLKQRPDQKQSRRFRVQLSMFGVPYVAAELNHILQRFPLLNVFVFICKPLLPPPAQASLPPQPPQLFPVAPLAKATSNFSKVGKAQIWTCVKTSKQNIWPWWLLKQPSVRITHRDGQWC